MEELEITLVSQGERVVLTSDEKCDLSEEFLVTLSIHEALLEVPSDNHARTRIHATLAEKPGDIPKSLVFVEISSTLLAVEKALRSYLWATGDVHFIGDEVDDE